MPCGPGPPPGKSESSWKTGARSVSPPPNSPVSVTPVTNSWPGFASNQEAKPFGGRNSTRISRWPGLWPVDLDRDHRLGVPAWATPSPPLDHRDPAARVMNGPPAYEERLWRRVGFPCQWGGLNHKLKVHSSTFALFCVGKPSILLGFPKTGLGFLKTLRNLRCFKTQVCPVSQWNARIRIPQKGKSRA